MRPGTVLLRRYRLLAPLGVGGGGTTWHAEDEVFGEPVALKLVPASAEPSVLEALAREFSTLAGLAHPHLIRVRDLGVLREQSPARLFYTADLVEGVTLGKLGRSRGLPAVTQPLLDALSALLFLHRLGIRHGDFKPDNVLVDARTGRGTLLDLGCAAPIDALASTTVSGTRAYLAPELLRGERADGRADLFSVGVTLRELLGSTAPALGRLLDRLGSVEPGDRPGDVAEVIEALGGEPEGRRTSLRLGSVLVGRDVELGRFGTWLDDLSLGRPGRRVVVLHGGDGVGRTRLLRELLWRAQRRLDVVEGNARRPDGMSSLLRRASEAVADEGAMAVDRAFVARQRILARGAPVVLVLDDADALTAAEVGLLLAFARILEPGDPIALLVTHRTGLPVREDAVLDLGIGPLGRAGVAAWLGRDVAAAHVDAVMRASAGVPAEIVAIAAGAATGDLGLGDLERAALAGDAGSARIAVIRTLPSAERGVLARLAATWGRLDRTESAHLDDSAVDRLIAGGWVRRTTTALELVRSADVARIEGALDAEYMAPLHREAARSLSARLEAPGAEGEERASMIAGLVAHCAAAGDLDQAFSALANHRDLARAYPHAFRRAAERLAPLAAPPEVLHAAAEVTAAIGDSRQALRLVARALRRRPAPDAAFELRCLAGACYDSAGDGARAVWALGRALSHGTQDPVARARAQGRLALALVRRGAYDRAAGEATAALDTATDATARADLLCTVALCAAYLGRRDEAAERARRAADVAADVADPRVRFRVLSARALVAFRSGDPAAAAADYGRALDLVEEARTGDLVPPACLNRGAACHQLGDWGAALSAYERALVVARALGMTSTEVTLRFNLARLHSDIGSFDRAERFAHDAEESAREKGLPFLEGAALAVRADLCAWQGRADEARALLDRARALYDHLGAARELLEVDLGRARIELADADASRARAVAGALTDLSAQQDQPDLSARVGLHLGDAWLAAGDAAAATHPLEQALELASRTGERALEAQIEARLAECHRRAGNTVLARRHHEQARATWERVRGSLPLSLRETFDRHPARQHAEPATAQAPFPQRVADLERLLGLYRRMSSASTTAEVLREAMDAAIEISGAERGFLVLATEPGRPERGLSVPVARNVDREHVGRSHLKLSHGVAEQVIQSGELVVTVDATADDRFAASASVHAMRLKSILCVPIHSEEGVLGAIYLDNRFHVGGFAAPDVDLVLAFADQVSLALGRARLLERLQRRTEELETERAHVESLLGEQASRIESLSLELQRSRETRGRRFDYTGIVGSSIAMQKVFDVLDRLIETDVTVLVTGESGTGKELIARAIHAQGHRNEGPFVAINCGALPAELLEAELFGYRRGAFTGATRDHPGLFVAAHGGTLFLDELGDMPPSMQVKLLRALQERCVRPLGASEMVSVDVRLIAATHRDLGREVAEGRFREDLYYRVAVVTVEVPPLRQRLDDMPELVRSIVARVAAEHGRPEPEIDPGFLRALMASPWPGNVRQLENVLTRALLLSDRAALRREDLGLDLPAARGRAGRLADEARVRAALESTGWNVAEAARRLGVSRATLYRRIHRHGLRRAATG